MTANKFLYHTQCPHCAAQGRDRSGDNLAVYDGGFGNCMKCKAKVKMDTDTVHVKRVYTNNEQDKNMDFIVGEYEAIEPRKIPESICRQYGYQIGERFGEKAHIANFYDDSKTLIGQKYRMKGKRFSCNGDISGLWGKQLWTTGKKIVITEGELDCLSVATVQGGKWPTVSIPNGAAGAKKCLMKEMEWLQNNFDEIILMLDNDEPGLEAAKECAELFEPGKCRIAKLPVKDASECLMLGKDAEIINAIWRAPVFRPDGIINANDVVDSICAAYKPADALYPWGGLNEITRGLRKGEIVTFCAGTGIGKSQIMRELAYHILKENPTTGVGYIALEVSIKRTSFGLMSNEAERLLHLDETITEAELREYHGRVFGNNNVYLWDHWGSLDPAVLISKIRYLANGCGVQWIVLDHISIIVSGMVGGDERRELDNIMTNLRKLVEELNVGLLLVSHLKRPEGKAHEEGAKTSLGQLRGSASIGQLSDLVIGVERNQQDPEKKHVSTVRVLKNRFSGDTGVACTLNYNTTTGRMVEDDALAIGTQEEEEIIF